MTKPRSPKSAAKTTKPRAKTAVKPKTTAKAQGAASAKPKTAVRRAPARRPAAKPPQPRRRIARAGKTAPTGRIARILQPRNLAIAFVLLIAIAAGYRFWLRDSSLVAVTGVTVTGADGPEAARVQAALERSGLGMSTLNVDDAALAKAVAPFRTVAGVHADSDFPHGLTVAVDSRPPTMLLEAGKDTVPVAGDGTILGGVDVGKEKLPTIKVDSLPAGKKVTGDELEEATLTGAAPEPLHKLIDKIRVKGDQGVVITMAGLPVIFGTADRTDEKWVAVAATLSDPKLDSLSYLDVRVPDRPAAGGAGESLADAPDPTTVAPTDIVPATTETAAPADPAVETTTPAATDTDPVVSDPTATDQAAAPVEQAVAPPADTTAAPTATDTSGASSAGTTSGGGVTP